MLENRGISHRHIYFAFFFGGMGGLLTQWSMTAVSPTATYETTMPMFFLAVIVAPILEELAKPVGLYLFMGEERPQLTLQEWAILGCMAGFGFMVLENFLYGFQAPISGLNGHWLLALRYLMPLHIIATGITGFGIGLWVKTRKASYFIMCITVAMLLHGLHNFTSVLMEGSL